MKLELKHLAPYLPYGLKTTVGELIGLKNHLGWCGVFMDTHGFKIIPISAVKPALRNLSDLTKEIEHNGERFVPFNWFDKNYAPLNCSHEEMYNHFVKETRTVMPYVVIEKLFEWHFDVFGLLDNNLAIPLDTNRK